MKSTVILQKDRDTTQTTQNQSYSSYILPNHDIEANLNAVLTNDYAKACVDDLVFNTVGKGFEKIEGVPKELLEPEPLDRFAKDYEKSGNGFLEVKVHNKQVKEIYHIPAATMKIKLVKQQINIIDKLNYSYKVFVQNNKTDKEWNEFTAYTLKDSKMADGSYILHIMNYEDDPHYGTPAWLPALQKMRTSTAADIHNASFFDNGCKLEGIIWTKGELMDDATAKNVESMMKGTTKVSGGHKLLKIEMEDKDSEIGFLPLNTKTDGTHLQLLKEYRVAICSAFKVPPKKIGIETSGQLGNGDYQEQLNAYYEDIITPRQEFYEARFKWLFPDSEIKLKRPVIRSSKSVELSKGHKTIDTLLALRQELLQG